MSNININQIVSVDVRMEGEVNTFWCVKTSDLKEISVSSIDGEFPIYTNSDEKCEDRVARFLRSLIVQPDNWDEFQDVCEYTVLVHELLNRTITNRRVYNPCAE